MTSDIRIVRDHNRRCEHNSKVCHAMNWDTLKMCPGGQELILHLEADRSDIEKGIELWYGEDAEEDGYQSIWAIIEETE